MSDQVEPEAPTTAGMSDPAEPEVPRRSVMARAAEALPGRSGWGDARARIKDLIIVFFGVYAAFSLNRWESDRRDMFRRGQILEALEREVTANAAELRPALTSGQTEAETFDRKLAAGEMPDLAISYNNSSYSPSDDATLLQAGGIEVLDVQMLDGLRKINGLRRSFVAALQNQHQLELTILGARESGGFYDPDTKQLKKHYAWYPVVLHHVIDDARTLLAGEEEFLELIRAKRRGR